MAFRVDIGTLRPPQKLPDGRLRADGYLTRSGVFKYANPDGSVRLEYRPDEEVFKADSLETFADVPVTDNHPTELVTAENARKYSVGHISGTPRQDGDHVAASVVVMDAETIGKLERGKVALSCGYECDLIEMPGVTPDGLRYDAIQTNIRGNHVAIVDVARAGHAARLRMDAATMILSEPEAGETKENTVDIEKLQAALAAANEAVGAAKARADELEGELAAVTARADAAEIALKAEKQARLDHAAGEGDRVRARVALETAAAPILGAEFKADASDRDIKLAVVKRVDGDELAADSHDMYINGRFEAAVKTASKADADLSLVRRAAEAGRQHTPVDRNAARAEMIKRIQNPSAE